MIKIENADVYGFEAAIRGMRSPLNSWAKSDSKWCVEPSEECLTCENVQCYNKFVLLCPNTRIYLKTCLW